MLFLHGMGDYLPEHELTNEFLHAEVGLERTLDWVASRLGIERRFSVLSPAFIRDTKNRKPAQAVQHARANGLTPVTMGARAAERAIRAASLTPSDIGLVLAANDTPFETAPSTAFLIARALGIRDGAHGDLNTACSSFARHLKAIDDMKESAVPDFVLCVQSSALTTRVDYGSHCADGYILGDGAAAQVVSVRHPGRIAVEPLVFHSDPGRADEIVIDGVGYFVQHGANVRASSIRSTCAMYEEMAAKKGLDLRQVYSVSHQANHVMQNSVIGHLHIPEEKHLRNVKQQGNIAGAGCPSVIAQNWSRFKAGDRILYTVVGAGLAWGGGAMEVLKDA